MKLDKSGLRRIIKHEIASARQEAALRPSAKLSMTRIREIILEEVTAVKKQRLAEAAQGMRRTSKLSLVEALLGEADSKKAEQPVVTASDVKKAMHDGVAKSNPEYAKNNLPGAFLRRVRSSDYVCKLIGKGDKPTYNDIADYIAIQLSKKDGGLMSLIDRQLDMAPAVDVSSAELDEMIYDLAMRGIYTKYPHAASSSHSH